MVKSLYSSMVLLKSTHVATKLPFLPISKIFPNTDHLRRRLHPDQQLHHHPPPTSLFRSVRPPLSTSSGKSESEIRKVAIWKEKAAMEAADSATGNSKILNVGLLLVATLVAAKLISVLIMPRSRKRLPPEVSVLPVLGGLIQFMKGPVVMLREEHLSSFSILRRFTFD